MDALAGRSCFFGFGSLVNCSTHDYPGAKPATLQGWRRRWVQVGAKPNALLSAYPAKENSIDGLIADVPNNDWEALDLREDDYRRHSIAHLIEASSVADDIQVYSVPETSFEVGMNRKPILLTYLDVVLRGYRDVFGEKGPRYFIETTDGWDRPILNDREAPLYPRHQALDQADRYWIDEILAVLPSTIVSAD